MSQNLECRVSVSLLLEAAHRLFSYDKVPFALALLHIVLEQHPNHERAQMLHKVFTGESIPAYPISGAHRLYCDPEAGTFFVGDKGSEGNIPFKTLEEAERYLRGLK